jgi:hypothetical protein
MMMMLG